MKKKIFEFFFVEVHWRDLPRIILAWLFAFFFLVAIFWAITKIAFYFHL